jgi:aryl-alcohol dehydrogenase-like predicted oxidoreductase
MVGLAARCAAGRGSRPAGITARVEARAREWARELGKSEIPTTAFALGLAALGRPGYLNLGHGGDFDDRSVEGMAERAHEVLDAAYASGVRHFDAARSYGRAEEFLGRWLRSRQVEPGAVTVSSKWGYTYTAGWRIDADPPEVKDLTVGTFRRQLLETRELLGPYLMLYQIHSATLSSGVVDDPELAVELDALRDAGVAVGLSTSGPEQGATIERAIETGRFDTVQTTWNLLERSAGPALRSAHEAGLGVMIKEALANGRLTSRGGIAPLARAAAKRGVTEDALALAGVLAQPWVDTVLSGASTIEQLRSNLAGFDVPWPDELDAELAVLAEPPERYWKTRSSLPWT